MDEYDTYRENKKKVKKLKSRKLNRRRRKASGRLNRRDVRLNDEYADQAESEAIADAAAAAEDANGESNRAETEADTESMDVEEDDPGFYRYNEGLNAENYQEDYVENNPLNVEATNRNADTVDFTGEERTQDT